MLHYLHGPPGRGKTTRLLEVAATSAGGEYIDWREGEAYPLHVLTAPLVLCVDEVGNTPYADWSAGHLHRAVLVRLACWRTTWLAGHSTIDELARHPHPDMRHLACLLREMPATLVALESDR